MNYPGARLLVFSKAPEPGQVKTRLIPLLGELGAARMYADLLAACVRRMSEAKLCPVQLHCAPDTVHPCFRQLGREHAVTLVPQVDGDLGRRMAHAMQLVLGEADSALLIGVDCPALRVADLEHALGVLQDGVDVVLGPAHDGGYYLIGLRNPQPELFRDMPWGTDAVFDLTVRRVRALGLSLHRLPRYRDIDTPDDYRAWRVECI